MIVCHMAICNMQSIGKDLNSYFTFLCRAFATATDVLNTTCNETNKKLEAVLKKDSNNSNPIEKSIQKNSTSEENFTDSDGYETFSVVTVDNSKENSEISLSKKAESSCDENGCVTYDYESRYCDDQDANVCKPTSSSSNAEFKNFSFLEAPQKAPYLILQRNPWAHDKKAHKYFQTQMNQALPEKYIQLIAGFDVKLLSSDFFFRLVSCQTSRAVKTLVEALIPFECIEKDLLRKSYINHLIAMIHYLRFRPIPPDFDASPDFQPLHSSCWLSVQSLMESKLSQFYGLTDCLNRSTENEDALPPICDGFPSLSSDSSNISYDHLEPSSVQKTFSPIGSERTKSILEENNNEDSNDDFKNLCESGTYELFPNAPVLCPIPPLDTTLLSDPTATFSIPRRDVISPVSGAENESILESNSPRNLSNPSTEEFLHSIDSDGPDAVEAETETSGSFYEEDFMDRQMYEEFLCSRTRDNAFGSFQNNFVRPSYSYTNHCRPNRVQYADHYSYMYDNIRRCYLKSCYRHSSRAPFPYDRCNSAIPIKTYDRYPSSTRFRAIHSSQRFPRKLEFTEEFNVEETTIFEDKVPSGFKLSSESLDESEHDVSRVVETLSPSVQKPSSVEKNLGLCEKEYPVLAVNEGSQIDISRLKLKNTKVTETSVVAENGDFSVIETGNKEPKESFTEDTSEIASSLFSCIFKTSVHRQKEVLLNDSMETEIVTSTLPPILGLKSFRDILKEGVPVTTAAAVPSYQAKRTAVSTSVIEKKSKIMLPAPKPVVFKICKPDQPRVKKSVVSPDHVSTSSSLSNSSQIPSSKGVKEKSKVTKTTQILVSSSAVTNSQTTTDEGTSRSPVTPPTENKKLKKLSKSSSHTNNKPPNRIYSPVKSIPKLMDVLIPSSPERESKLMPQPIVEPIKKDPNGTNVAENRKFTVSAPLAVKKKKGIDRKESSSKKKQKKKQLTLIAQNSNTVISDELINVRKDHTFLNTKCYKFKRTAINFVSFVLLHS